MINNTVGVIKYKNCIYMKQIYTFMDVPTLTNIYIYVDEPCTYNNIIMVKVCHILKPLYHQIEEFVSV